MLNFLNMRPQTNSAAMSPADAIARSASGDVVVVDVRDHNEIAMTGKAKGAVHIPLSTLRMKADPRSPEFHPELSTDKPIAVYCASGARSQMATQLMSQMGLEAHNIGGLMHWQAAGGPCE